ncbi:hypothetical protein [Mesorhizobium sp.]|uniref:hypothetical protein n=1 Tax=Mesorhizobium sp. TaxID=1871066 RepID=UPI001228E1D6|nr:hypothetical protein [Mesorhizobium sp.]TIP09444.1 MAG: hypothetical protein E5X73_27480 [Mesorhizobium sp.]
MSVAPVAVVLAEAVDDRRGITIDVYQNANTQAWKPQPKISSRLAPAHMGTSGRLGWSNHPICTALPQITALMANLKTETRRDP